MEFSKIKKVYMLYHINSINDKKVIGFFSSKEKALQILQEYKTKDGFKNEQNNFFLKTMRIGKNYYIRGFKSKSL